MRSEMTSAEFFLWIAEYEANPWGPERNDLASAIIAREIVGWAGKTMKEGAPPPKAIDFMPYLQPEPEPLSDDYQSIVNFTNQNK